MRLFICGSYAIASDHAVFSAATKKIMIYGLMMVTIILVGTLTGIGVASLMSTPQEFQYSPDEKVYSGVGTIISSYTIDLLCGWYYAIKPEPNQHDLPWQYGFLIPINSLPEEFQEDGLKVKFTVKMATNTNVHTVEGQSRSDAIVEIIEIEKLI